MKLIHKLIFVGAASVMPTALASTAFAGEPIDTTPIAYSIALNSSVKPMDNGGLRYPAAAAVRGQSGFCDVRLDVAPTGETANVEVLACTSDAFRREARRIASGLRYGKSADDVSLRIRWNIEPTAAITTASLR